MIKHHQIIPTPEYRLCSSNDHSCYKWDETGGDRKSEMVRKPRTTGSSDTMSKRPFVKGERRMLCLGVVSEVDEAGGWACVGFRSQFTVPALDSNTAELTQMSYPYFQHWRCSPHGLVCFAGPAPPWTPPPADSRCCSCCHPASSLEMSSSLESQDSF